MKQLLLFFLLIGTTISLFSESPFDKQSSNMFGGSGMGQGGLLPMPSEAELEEINKFLSTLSEEELKELAELGEEIMKTAEKEGIPLFYDGPTEKPAVPERKPDTKKPDTKPAKKTETAPKNVTEAVQRLLTNLIRILDAIRLKTSNDNELEDILTPLDGQLNTLLYYLHVLNDPKIAGYLKDKEFQKPYDTLLFLEVELGSLNDRYSVPTINTRAKNINKRALDQARKTLNSIISLLQRAFNQEQLNTELEKVLKKYEPEALRIKKELESKEKQAQDAVKKIPVTNTGKMNPGAPASYQPAPGSGVGPAPYSNAPGGYPSLPTTGNNSRNTPLTQQPGATKPTDKKPTTPATQPKDIKPASADFVKMIENELDSIENVLVPNHASLTNFLQSYKPGTDEPALISGPLSEANFALKRVQKTVKKWTEAIEKEAKNAADLKQKVDVMANSFKSNKDARLKGLHQQTKDLSAKKVSLDGTVKKFKELMDDIEKKLTGKF